jgi:hypothetical protein
MDGCSHSAIETWRLGDRGGETESCIHNRGQVKVRAFSMIGYALTIISINAWQHSI